MGSVFKRLKEILRERENANNSGNLDEASRDPNQIKRAKKEYEEAPELFKNLLATENMTDLKVMFVLDFRHFFLKKVRNDRTWQMYFKHCFKFFEKHFEVGTSPSNAPRLHYTFSDSRFKLQLYRQAIHKTLTKQIMYFEGEYLCLEYKKDKVVYKIGINFSYWYDEKNGILYKVSRKGRNKWKQFLNGIVNHVKGIFKACSKPKTYGERDVYDFHYYRGGWNITNDIDSYPAFTYMKLESPENDSNSSWGVQKVFCPLVPIRLWYTLPMFVKREVLPTLVVAHMDIKWKEKIGTPFMDILGPVLMVVGFIICVVFSWTGIGAAVGFAIMSIGAALTGAVYQSKFFTVLSWVFAIASIYCAWVSAPAAGASSAGGTAASSAAVAATTTTVAATTVATTTTATAAANVAAQSALQAAIQTAAFTASQGFGSFTLAALNAGLTTGLTFSSVVNVGLQLVGLGISIAATRQQEKGMKELQEAANQLDSLTKRNQELLDKINSEDNRLNLKGFKISIDNEKKIDTLYSQFYAENLFTEAVDMGVHMERYLLNYLDDLLVYE